MVLVIEVETNQIRVLLIEDNPGDARLIQEELSDAEPFYRENTQFWLSHTDRLSQGIECLSNETIDIIILDLGLSDSLGIDTFTKLYEHSPQVPIIVLTGFDDEKLAVKAVGEGAQDYLVKGKIDRNLLKRSICYAIERHRLLSKLRDYTENLEQLVEERTKAQKDSEAKLQAILSGIGDDITIQNKDLDIIWANKPLKERWGNIIGKKCFKVYKGLEEKCPNCTVDKVYNKGGTVVSEAVNTLPDGRKVDVLVTSSPIRDDEGNIVAVVEVTKDITKQKKLERQLRDYTENLELLVEERTKALRESEERLKAILTGIGDLITIQNKDLNIIWANRLIKDIWGDIIGKKCYKVYKGLAAPCPNCTVETVFDEGKTFVSERPSILPDGSTIQMLTTSSPVRDVEGNIVAVVEVVKDVTERKQLENKLKEYTENLEKRVEERTFELKESEERYRGLYDSSIDGIASADVKGNIVDCNQAFADMHGYKKEELYKSTYHALTPNKWHDVIDTIVTEQLIPQGYSDEFEIEHIKKDGTIFPVSVRAWLIKDKEGYPTGTWAIFRDITERYRLMEMKEQFISVATHELRTPLISIKGYVDFLFSEDLEPISELTKASLEVVRRNTDRLLHLTDDLMDLQRIKSEKLHLELGFLDLIELINHCTEEIQPFINEKKQNFHVNIPDDSLLIQGDNIRLSQAIMNLLNNAAKFAPEGGTITLFVEEKENFIQIQVSDTGIGLQKEDLERIFQPFANIKKSTYIKGTGLGLSVTKGLVEAHGGKILANSEGEGKGATFTIFLPKRKLSRQVIRGRKDER
jgi:PAS domain S-box-containing protein